MDIKTKRFYVIIKYMYHTLKSYICFLLGKHKLNYKIKKRNIFIFMSADYGNLGDVAITLAQQKFLFDYFKEYNIIEIPISYTYNELKHIRKRVKKNDIITIIGGGNMSNRYEYFETIRRLICKIFKKNLIISFPQTVDFTNDMNGIYSKKLSSKTYSNIKNAIFIAREQKSYSILSSMIFSNEIIIVPDIVFYLNTDIRVKKQSKRNDDIGFCIRNDMEIIDSNSKLIECIKSKIPSNRIKFFDTYIGDKNITISNREKELFKIIDFISSLKYVVTDRLHCMIFCCLTNTPCLVLDNSNHKIENVYNTWIKNKFNVKLIKTLDDINEIEKTTNCKNKNNCNYDYEFDELYKKINLKLEEM